MTQEEIIQAISDDKMMPFIQPEQLAEIVDFVIKNYNPSIPSSLDEAAEEYARDWYWRKYASIPNACRGCYAHIVGAVRFGAEWMAGQFQKIEGDLVDWYSTSDGKDYCCGIKTQDVFEVPEGFYIKKK